MEEVRRLRHEKGWNQTELAYHAELAPSVISLIETGRRDPNASTLRKLANALGVEIPDLFGRGVSPKAESPRRPGTPAELRKALDEIYVREFRDELPETTEEREALLRELIDKASELELKAGRSGRRMQEWIDALEDLRAANLRIAELERVLEPA